MPARGSRERFDSMKGKEKATSEPESSVRATLTSVPKLVLEGIVNHLGSNDKVNLILCCKAMLPLLWTGHVSASVDPPNGGRRVTQLSRRLTEQPNGVSHLTLFSPCVTHWRVIRKLIDLSVLFNLRKLSLDSVAFSLAALQPVATRLQSLEITNTRLRGSADGFLRAGWTALCYLRFRSSRVVDDILTAVYLPALEALDVISFQHKGGILQQDQLCLPQLCKLTFLLHSSQMRVSEGGRQSCSFLNLPRLASLVLPYFPEFRIDLDLPASLEHLTLQDFAGGEDIDLKQLLLEVIKGIKSGARLCSLTCAGTAPSHHPEGMPWGASSVAYYRDLGEQLRGLKSLLVCGRAWTLLSAVGAVACSAPDLTHLQFRVNGHPHPDVMELPPVSSASLESITVGFELFSWHRGPPPPVVLTILPGCTQLRDVRVQFYYNTPKEGTSVKIRCHCTSQRCIIPLDAAGLEEVGVHFLQMPLSSQGVQAYTVICTCQAAGPEQGLRWGHLVMPGVL